MNVMEQVLNVPTQEVITKDNASVSADAVDLLPGAERRAGRLSGLQSAKMRILNLTMTNIRSVMGSMDLDELLSNRDTINDRLLRVVDEAVGPWGIKVTRVEIKDIQPPKDLVDAMAPPDEGRARKARAGARSRGRRATRRF